MATGYIHKGTIAGKLKGVIPAHTPSGWRSDHASICGPTLRVNSPFSNCGIPQTNSTTSRPRCTSPSASSCVLPCSRDISRATASAFFVNSSLNLNMIPARLRGGKFAQAGRASCAASIAASTSADDDNPRVSMTSPVAGLKTSCWRPLFEATRWPETRFSIMAIPKNL